MASTYLNRTVASASNRKTWTYSAWIKRSGIGNTQTLLVSWSDGNNHSKIRLESDKVHVYDLTSGSFSYQVKTNRMLRDTSAWYHIVVAFDTTQSTASNRLKIYVNGEQETSLAESSYPAEDYEGFINRNRVHSIGYNANNSNYFDGYMSHVALVDGTALTPTSFGETDSTSGIWKFKSPSGVTWGTNGFHLKFENSGALGTDSSGQSNTFTVNGNLKQALDTPSNVSATWNPFSTSQTFATTFSSGNNRFRHSEANEHNVCCSTLGFNKGKWYAEFKVVSDVASTSMQIGISSLNTALTTATSVSGLEGSGYQDNGVVYRNGYSDVSSLTTFAQNDIIGVACDFDNKMIYWYKNGTLLNSTGYAFTLNAGVAKGDFYGFACSGYQTSGDDIVVDANFGNGYFNTTAISSAGSNGNGYLFEYDVPSGYYALNTKNLNTYG
jgi:hypothetical protein